jgi:flagellar basal-body rod protein FlgB
VGQARRDLNAKRHGFNTAIKQLIEKLTAFLWQRNCSGNAIMVENLGSGIERYMNLRTTRQKLVAANIANADTPGFKTKDIDFQSEFENQVANSNPNVMDVPGLQTKNDGNNVSVDREARLLAENALRFSVATNLARSELSTVKMAIEEDKSS